MILDYNNNFIKFINKTNKKDYIEGNTLTKDLVKIRYLKPIINYKITKKNFETKNIKNFNITTIYNSIIAYGNVNLLLNNYGAYLKNIVFKNKIAITKPWYKTYNNINCIVNFLYINNKQKLNQFKVNTILINYNKFKIINTELKKKINYTYSMLFSRKRSIKGNLWFFNRNYLEYILKDDQKKLLTLNKLKHGIQLKYGIFWYLFNLLNNGINNLNFLLDKLSFDSFSTIILKKYLLKKKFIIYLIKIIIYILKKVSKNYVYFIKHLFCFFFNKVYHKLLLEKYNKINNLLIIKNNFYKKVDKKLIKKVNKFSFYYFLNYKYINKKIVILIKVFILFLIYIVNKNKKLNLFKKAKPILKVNINKITLKKDKFYFLDIMIFLRNFYYVFSNLVIKEIKKKIINKKQNKIFILNKIVFNY